MCCPQRFGLRLDLANQLCRSLVNGHTTQLAISCLTFCRDILDRCELPALIGRHHIDRPGLRCLSELIHEEPQLLLVGIGELAKHVHSSSSLLFVARHNRCLHTLTVILDTQLVFGRIPVHHLTLDNTHSLQGILGNARLRQGTKIGTLLSR